MEPSRCCLECGQSFQAGERRLYCPTCTREPTVADAIWATLGFALLAVVVACFVAFVFAPPTVFADENGAAVLQQLHEDIIAQAKAQSMAEGKPGPVPCYQVRRHGAAAVCITLDEWKRQHAEDRTAMPEERVGMRL